MSLDGGLEGESQVVEQPLRPGKTRVVFGFLVLVKFFFVVFDDVSLKRYSNLTKKASKRRLLKFLESSS